MKIKLKESLELIPLDDDSMAIFDPTDETTHFFEGKMKPVSTYGKQRAERGRIGPVKKVVISQQFLGDQL